MLVDMIDYWTNEQFIAHYVPKKYPPASPLFPMHPVGAIITFNIIWLMVARLQVVWHVPCSYYHPTHGRYHSGREFAMRRAGRNILWAVLVILPFFLSWVTTMAIPANRVHPESPTGIPHPVNTEAVGEAAAAENISLILLGAGILNLAMWGRSRWRRASAKSGDPV
jgi:hypothetical protein